MEVREPFAKYLHTRYEQTELGVLPTDWRIAAIGEIAETSSGTTPPRSQYERYFKGGVHAWVKTLDLNNAEILETDESVIRSGDMVLCPDGTGQYHVGEVQGGYQYAPGQVLPHRRTVKWLPLTIARAAMSEALRNSTGSIGTVSTITEHHQEIEQFLAALPGQAAPNIVATDPVVEDPVAFAMEKHLEDFLVKNWAQTELAQAFKIYEEDGELVGQQYSTDAGAIDILAVSKDGQRLLVVELKRGRASDVVVGQILRYMGYVKEQIAEPHQSVEGAIIALDDDQKLRWALAVVPSVSFYRYQVSFKLIKH